MHRIRSTAVKHRCRQQKASALQEKCTPSKRKDVSQSISSMDSCGCRSGFRVTGPDLLCRGWKRAEFRADGCP